MSVIVTNSGVETSTPSAPSSVVSASSGSLDTSANYSYKVTFVNPWGETVASAASSNTMTAASTPALDVTIPVSSDTTVSARKVYRTQGGGSTWTLLTTISNNTTTTFTDTTADGSLGAAVPPLTSSAMTAQIVRGNFKLNQPAQFAGVASITAGTTQTQAGATAIGLNQFASVTTGNANDGVILPLLNANIIGMAIHVNNLSANALRVYPNTGQTINSGTVDVHVTHAASIGRWYVSTTATNWVQV